MTFRPGQRGNVFTILLGGVAFAGALSYIVYQTLSGPVASMVRVTHGTAAQAQMHGLARSVVVDTLSQGDCDDDTFLEPRAWTTGTGPTNGGQLPAAMAASVADPWGMTYGYCVWDVGADNNPAVDNGCGAGVNRLAGADATILSQASGLQTLFAVVSAGPDRRFQTTCKTRAVAVGDMTNDVIATTAGSDDIVLR